MSTPINDGGPAFPQSDVYHPSGQIEYGTPGMSLRDWFAGRALQGWLASFGPNLKHPVDADTADGVARQSYGMADAMLAARGKATP